MPELDKLIRMSHLFGVTLDELVSGEEPGAVPVSPSACVPPAPREGFSPRKVAGTVLFCMGFLTALLLSLLGGLAAGLVFASPFLVCGGLCFLFRRRAGLWCGWAAYLCIDLYLRFATGLSWTTVFMTHLWTAQMNYARLAISWVQFIGMVLLILCTVRSYRTLKVSATKKEVTWLIAGWLAALVVLPLLMSYGVMPLLLDDLGNYSNISPYFLLNVLYSYVRLALINVLLVRSLAVWRLRREEKKAKN